MNRYIVIDLQDNVIYNTNDLKYLFYDEFDRFGSSISCIDKEDLINEVKDIMEDLKDKGDEKDD